MKKLDELQLVAANDGINDIADVENKKPLNDAELTSIRALVAYVAYVTELPESFVECALCDKFDAGGMQNLTADDYTTAVVWLIDWEPPMVN